MSGRENRQGNEELLKKKIIRLIEQHYFEEINVALIKNKSLSDIIKTLDKDSYLFQTDHKESDFVRGFSRKKNTVDGIKLLPQKVGYLKLSYFSQSTPKELQKAFYHLEKEGAKKFILDLKGNPGGDFKSAVSVAETFIEKDNTLVTLKKRDGEQVYRSHNNRALNFPMVVIVDSQTASSAEMMAVTLRENKGIKVIGTRTQGKRTVQQFFPIESFWMVLTVGTWSLAKENSYDSAVDSILPDFLIEEHEQQIEKAVSILTQEYVH